MIIEHIRTPPDLAKLPPEGRPIIGWLLAKDPLARPQRASALLPILYGVEPVPVVQASVTQRSVVAPSPVARPHQPLHLSRPSGRHLHYPHTRLARRSIAGSKRSRLGSNPTAC